MVALSLLTELTNRITTFCIFVSVLKRGRWIGWTRQAVPPHQNVFFSSKKSLNKGIWSSLAVHRLSINDNWVANLLKETTAFIELCISLVSRGKWTALLEALGVVNTTERELKWKRGNLAWLTLLKNGFSRPHWTSFEQITVSLAALAIGKPQGGNRFSVRAWEYDPRFLDWCSSCNAVEMELHAFPSLE